MRRALFGWAARGRLSVLTFHAVPRDARPLRPDELTAQQFEEQLSDLKQYLTFLPLSEAVQRLRAGTLPRGAASITLDDGYASWMDGVVPALDRLGLTATLFITTGQLQGRVLWNERLHHALDVAPPGTPALQLVMDGQSHRYAVDTLADRQRAVLALEQLTKYRPPAEKEQLILSVEAHCGMVRPGEGGPQRILTADQVLDLHRRGFEIGAHTETHPILARCTDDEARREIGHSRAVLSDLLGVPVAGFAYPNGQPGRDFDARHARMVREAGFQYAVTTGWGSAGDGRDPFTLPRFTPWGPGRLKRFVQMGRNLRQAPKVLPSPEPVAERRVLMVAFHFPPQAGSSGMLRTLNFAKYLPHSGWRASVLSATPGAYERTSMDLMPDVPPCCTVLRAGALDAARHLSVQGKYLGALAVPDRWVSWWPGAWLRARRELREAASDGQHYDVVWSTFPISTAHLIGAAVARSSRLPWVADFRDPMTAPGYPADWLRRRATQWIERYTLNHAQACVFTTAAAAQSYGLRYPQAAHRLHVVENGYDEDAFRQATPCRPGVADDVLLLLHSGGIYPGDRDPTALFKAVSGMINAGALARNRVCVRFRASGHDSYVRELAVQHGLQDVVDLAPPVPYREAIAEMMGADLLLLFQGTQFNRQIPAKLYEYVRAGRTVLALLDHSGQTAQVLRGYPGHLMANIGDAAEVQAFLTHWLHRRHALDQREALAESQILVKRNSRESQAVQLAELLGATSASVRNTAHEAASGEGRAS